ncbi:hypothetical protein AHMF7605_05330 [Adhaeribacter arboris]|uniref:Uncharacterized protein n=1 Tax=Adhaeribacter arboris TaxID=2072846 RepID=A0A2T2YC20_9BACT|nr:hypothetical protein AHMF7605_05330 [Adhaeribacter arboris]
MRLFLLSISTITIIPPAENKIIYVRSGGNSWFLAVLQTALNFNIQEVYKLKNDSISHSKVG